MKNRPYDVTCHNHNSVLNVFIVSILFLPSLQLLCCLHKGHVFFFSFFFILHLCMSVFVLARFDFVFLTFASLSRQCAWRDTQNLLIQIVSPIWATHTVHEEHTAQHSTSNTQHTHDMHNRQTIPHIRCGRFQKWIARCARENRLRRMLSIAVWIWM